VDKTLTMYETTVSVNILCRLLQLAILSYMLNNNNELSNSRLESVFIQFQMTVLTFVVTGIIGDLIK